MDSKLEGMTVAILVTDYFEQVEMTEPRKALEDAGARTMIIAPHGDTIQGFNHDHKGDVFRVDMALDDVTADQFDATLIPGGVLNSDTLRMETKAREFIGRIDREEKPIAAICHGPWLLVSAGLVKGRHLTSYYTIQDDVRNAGGDWEDSEVVRYRNWVSSRQPKDIPAFNREMIKLFSEYRDRANRKHAA